MSDEPIDLPKELDEANARLPIVLPDRDQPLEMQMRVIALTIAGRYVGDTSVKEGGLYQALKLDNKLGQPVSVEHVIRAALVFERYLWGEWSKGIVENAINATLPEAADAIEKELRKRGLSPELGEAFKDEPPIRPSAGSGEPEP